jgi:sulfide dehydrogenase cytochrome subunit
MKNKILLLIASILATTHAYATEPAAQRPNVERLAHACAGCHGTYGHSQAPTPALAGKPEREFLAMMRDFKSGQRVSSMMNRIAKAYTDEDVVAMAHFFKQQRPEKP